MSDKLKIATDNYSAGFADGQQVERDNHALTRSAGSLAGSDYRHIQSEKPWITAQIKKHCPLGIAFNILNALDIQEKEIERLNKIIQASRNR